MAQIPFVTTPHNSGLGDPLATAFEAQQSMNTELYNTVVFEVPGKGLSEANFTNADKAKLDSIVTPIAPQVQSDYGQTNALAIDFIKNKKTKTSDFVNDGDGSNPFVADVDTTGVFGRSNGGWVEIDVNRLTTQIEYTATGGETTHDIGTTKIVKSWFWDGSPQAKSQWTQAGSVLTFAFPLSAGSFNIFI